MNEEPEAPRSLDWTDAVPVILIVISTIIIIYSIWERHQ